VSCVVRYRSQLASFKPPARIGKEDDEIQKTPKHFAPESAALQPEEVEESDPFPPSLSPEQQKTSDINDRGVDRPPGRLRTPRGRITPQEKARRYHHLY